MNALTNNASPFLLLMPSYNQSHYIAQAVRSVLAQDDPDWQLWIVDNSTDNTPEVMLQFDDARIHFHHIPQRMDPGTCLNWMLERARGRDFSYIHTDNNLQPSYVRRMRAALAQHPMALAYCDMHTIDENGRHLRAFHRGPFDLPRLLSVSPLGVPFAATTHLAKKLGGFSVRDFADDVRFCISAYGLARYIYIPELLLEYRLHPESRTEGAGGSSQMIHNFIDLTSKLVPLLEERGLNPVQQIAGAVNEAFNEWDELTTKVWQQDFSPSTYWPKAPPMDALFLSGQLKLGGFTAEIARVPRRLLVRNKEGRICVPFWRVRKLRKLMRRNTSTIHLLADKTRNVLLPWVCLKLGITANEKISVRISSIDLRTLWAAHQLQEYLGWQPLVDPATKAPSWLKWDKATGQEPWLDCSSEIRLISTSEAIATSN